MYSLAILFPARASTKFRGLIEKERERRGKKCADKGAQNAVNIAFYVRQLQKTLVCHVSPHFIAGTIHEN